MNISFKLIYLLFLIGCASSKISNTNYEVIYEAQTRGNFEKIIFSNNKLQLSTRTDNKTVDLSKEKISTINNVLSKIKLSEIAGLESPSNKRAFDGAMNATITIKREKETFTSSSFDHDNPPKELKELVNFLRSFIK